MKIADALRELTAVRRGCYIFLTGGFAFGLCHLTTLSIQAGWTAQSIATIFFASLYGVAAAFLIPLDKTPG